VKLGFVAFIFVRLSRAKRRKITAVRRRICLKFLFIRAILGAEEK